MEKNWLKTDISITMEGPDHENPVRRTFSSAVKDATPAQVTTLTEAVSSLSVDEITEAQIKTVESIALV